MPESDEFVDILLYSDDATTRDSVMTAVGRRAGKGLPLIRWDETATAPAVVSKVEKKRYGLLVLDAEAAKVGGMAVSRQLKQEIYNCPPVLLLIARPQDAWLATWSLAEAHVSAPYDPIELQQTIANLLAPR